MGRKGAMDPEIKPVTKGKKVIGTAFTVDLEPGDNLFLHEAIYLCTQGYVIVADGKNHKQNAYLGELMATAAALMGVEGIVIDGLVRDRSSLENIDIPIFAKGFIPNGPYKNGPGSINTPIVCCGIKVNPGDLIFGDEDGVVVVAKENVSEIIELAEKKANDEKSRLDFLVSYSGRKLDADSIERLKPGFLKIRHRV
ncbi:RraA family protein [Neobacillus piezotolerans]|uniref:Putative 4-hydroxy-4-methyl-2-oxoglutarate aldolase n=2 Tax=Neobacillus piezotolerans TaxID=2259171 RepID=A0A3D8GWX3_9BACI|nr:RraA family protein [Neobacillus piezotolerans]